MRKRPGESPQQSGRRFERFWSALFGVKPQKGSGNTWIAKLDVADGSITWSCKFTSHDSFSMSKELLHEVDEGIYKNGDDSIPGIAVALDDGAETVVVLRAADFLRLLASDAAKYITPTKSAQKRTLAKIPNLLRDDSSD